MNSRFSLSSPSKDTGFLPSSASIERNTAFGSAPRPRVLDQFARSRVDHDHSPVSVGSGLGASRLPLPRWKRALDLLGCVIALPLLGLCTMAMIILNSWVSPGPVFFLQERVGYMGRRFRIYKFRTMRLGADCAIHQDHCRELIRTNAPMVKLDSRGDSRLIPLAWLIRASGLDELPQLINVFRGEMSLVGPRPCLPSEFAEYVSWQRQRCDTLPGLTGLWQVSGKNRTTFEQMIRLDIKYAREFSLWMDLKILFWTTPCLLRQVAETRLARRSPANRFPSGSSDRAGPTNAHIKARVLSASSIPPQAPAAQKSGSSFLGWLHELHQGSGAPHFGPTINAHPSSSGVSKSQPLS